ncbi:MAG TPA: single-stranded DNA-binding protein [Candidatus Ozemobacteraceae bacterium]|nr:single-stranded DNA-binding protein [Candidatus Ozemobacteraceae bacterium]
MAANLNKVFLMGNLTRDPELKYTPQGTAVAKFSIAVNRQFKGGDGEMKKEVNFFNIVVWGKSGENCSKYLTKGRPAFIEGRLQNRTYETQDKQKRTVTEIIADSVQFLGGGGAGGPGGPGRSAEEGGDAAPDYGGGDADYPAPGGDEVPF